MAGVFRRPHDYRPTLGVVAVLFPVGGPDSPPLQQPSVQQIVATAFRTPFQGRPVFAFPSQLFPGVVVDAPPLSQPVQRTNQRAAAHSFYTQKNPASIDLLELFEVDGPAGQGDTQEAAHAFYRRQAPFQVRPAFPGFLVPPVEDLPPLQAQQPPASAFRALPKLGAPAPFPIYLFSQDDPPLKGADPQATATAFFRSIARQAAQINYGPLFDVPVVDSPPLRSYGQEAGWGAYRPAAQPQRPVPLFSPALFPPVVDGPPLVGFGQQAGISAYRPPFQPPRPLPLFHPGIFPPVVDDPPLFVFSPQGASQAFRSPPAYRVPASPPSALFDVVIPPDFPFRDLAQGIVRSAYRAGDWVTIHQVYRLLRSTPFDALFPPPVVVVPPATTVTQLITGYATKAQAEALKSDIAALRRRLEFLIGLMEKGAGGKRLKT